MRKRVMSFIFAAAVVLSLSSYPVMGAVSEDSSQSSSESSSEDDTPSEALPEGEGEQDGEGILPDGTDAPEAPDMFADDTQLPGEVIPDTEDAQIRPGSGTPMMMEGLQSKPESAMISEDVMQNPVTAEVSVIITDSSLAAGLFPGEPEDSVVFEARLQSGDFIGTTVTAVQRMDSITAPFLRHVRPGDEVYLTIYRDEVGVVRGVLSDYNRTRLLTVMAGVAALLLLLFCRRWSGLKTVASIAAALLLVRYAFLPMLRAGMPPVAAGYITCAAIMLIAILLLYGIKYRTIASCIGSLLGIGVAGLFIYVTDSLLRLSGVTSVVRLRNFYSEALPRDMSSLMLVGVMLSAAGAVLIISNTVAAGADPKLSGERFGRATPTSVFRAGCARGCAALSPVIITLVFAAGGYMLSVLVLLHFGGMPFGRVLSDEIIATELLRMFAGIVGLLLCIPITAGAASLLFPLRRVGNGELREFYVKEALVEKQQRLFSSIAQRLEGTSKNAVNVSTKGEEKPSDEAPAIPEKTEPPEDPHKPTDNPE